MAVLTAVIFLGAGGPLGGTLAADGRPAYRNARDGAALENSIGDRWLRGHRYESDNPKVLAKAAGIYARHSSAGYSEVCVWGPIAGGGARLAAPRSGRGSAPPSRAEPHRRLRYGTCQ
jgi:hypothetical protein